MSGDAAQPKAVQIPRDNEKAAIWCVWEALPADLPWARLYVFGNGSSDRAAKVASAWVSGM